MEYGNYMRIKVINEQPTLRDQFAMAALAGMLADPECAGQSKRVLVEHAYQYADAMIEARKQGGDS